MKTSFKGQILSAVVFAMAISGAVSTHAMNKSSKSFAVVKGHSRISGSPSNCQERKDCITEDIGNPPCKFTGLDLWGKTSPSSQCTVPLYEMDPQ